MTSRNQSAPIGPNERAELFHERYGDDVDAGRTLAGIVVATGDYIARIVGQTDADAAMSVLVKQLVDNAGLEHAEAGGWKEALGNATSLCFSYWPLGGVLHDLTAYAIYGIVLNSHEDETPPETRIENLLTAAVEFDQATPHAQWRLRDRDLDNADLRRLIDLASGRWALDNGRPIEPRALAALGGVSEGRVRNMMSGPNRRFEVEDGGIPAHEALAWLSDREEFWNSIWRNQIPRQHGPSRRSSIDRAVFVPVARDDTAFHPGLVSGGNYTIGPKGAELHIHSFDDALAELHRMEKPSWRRPNGVGNWGIVAGVRWQRLDASELAALASSPDPRIPDDGRV